MFAGEKLSCCLYAVGVKVIVIFRCLWVVHGKARWLILVRLLLNKSE